MEHVRYPVAQALELDEVRGSDLIESAEPLHLHYEQDRFGQRLETLLLQPARQRLRQVGWYSCEPRTWLRELSILRQQLPRVPQGGPNHLHLLVAARLGSRQHVHVTSTAAVIDEHVLVPGGRYVQRGGDVHDVAVSGEHLVCC